MVTTERAGQRPLLIGVDEGFPGRTLRSSLLFSVIVCVFAVVWESGRTAPGVVERHAISIGFAIGAAIGLTMLGLLIWVVRSVVRTPEEGKPRRSGLLIATMLLQLPVYGAALYGGVRYLGDDLRAVLALAAGLGVWIFVAALKVASILLIGPRPAK